MSVESRLTIVEEALRNLRDADRLQGRRFSAKAPGNTETVGWNKATKKWEPQPVQHHFAITATNDGWESAVTGTGAVALAGHSLRVASGTTSGSKARWRTDDNEICVTRGVNSNVIDWTRSVALGFRLVLTATTTNGLARISIGKTSGDGVGALGRKAIGIQITNLALAGQVHDGSSLTDTATLKTMTEDEVADVYIVSDGVGNVEWFFNDESIGSSTGGPAASGTVGECRIYEEVDNGADSADQRLVVSEIWIADLG